MRYTLKSSLTCAVETAHSHRVMSGSGAPAVPRLICANKSSAVRGRRALLQRVGVGGSRANVLHFAKQPQRLLQTTGSCSRTNRTSTRRGVGRHSALLHTCEDGEVVFSVVQTCAFVLHQHIVCAGTADATHEQQTELGDGLSTTTTCEQYVKQRNVYNRVQLEATL